MTQPPERPDTGSGLGEKIGPLPAWGWIALAAAGAVGVLLWLQRRNAASSSTTTTPSVAPSTADVANLQDQLATVNSQIRNLQGANSTPTGPTDQTAYLFKLPGDPDGPGAIYAGVPGVGWYWVPNTDVLSAFQKAKNPIWLGVINQDLANTRFGAKQAWASYGQAPQGAAA